LRDFAGVRESAHEMHLGADRDECVLIEVEDREIEAAFSKIKVHGGRMNEEQMKVVDHTDCWNRMRPSF
jgi:hypothetical protein